MSLRSARSAMARLRNMLGASSSTPPPLSQRAAFQTTNGGQWYDPVLLSPATVGRLATSEATLRDVIHVLDRLEPDDYLDFVRRYYREGLERYGASWVFADILTVLSAACQLLRPSRYLEIGVRRGRSMAMVVSQCPACDVVGFDLWVEDYAGMANPGPDFVRGEMEKLGLEGTLELISGSSHRSVPAYFREHPDRYFDLVTVDGDHTARGAIEDLRTVIPRLKRGGALVLDDIAHPHHPELESVWNEVVVGDGRLRAWEFKDLGFGVGVAIRA